MKSIAIQIIALLLLSLGAFSQEEIRISEEVKAMSKGEYNAYIVEIPQAKLKHVEKEWEKRIREGTKEKVVVEKDETSIQGAVLKRISTEPINIYSRMFETQDGVQLVAFFQNENGFISTATDDEKSSAIQVVLDEFGREVYRSVVEEELKEEEKKLKDLESDLQKLIDVNEKYHKSISENERKIGQIKDEINSNLGDQDRKNEEIEKQKDFVATLRNADEEQQETAKKQLKDLQKDKKKLQKDNEGMHKKIDNLESEIRQFERDIETNNEEQGLKQKEIAGQKEVVLNVKKKLDE